ncbi:MAG TPA: NlpC/P60 family protein [Mycobacteriales bacterium]|nr:NlpC/P60 family protein [Mycobacteriales bacterium]
MSPTLWRRRALGAAVAGVLVLLSPGVALATGSNDPSAAAAAKQAAAKHKALNAAQGQAAADKKRLANAQAAVASAQAQLTAMAATARTAIERYNTAMHQLRAAQDAADAARVALAAAAAEVSRMQAQVNEFARASYMAGGPLSTVAVVLMSGGPSAILDQAALLGAVSQKQQEMLQEFAAAQQRQAELSAAADAAQQKVQQIADRAAAARQAAMDALASQHTLISQLTVQQISVAKQLAAQENKVATLTVAQAAADARAKAAEERAALAAAWTEMQAAGDAMPWATAKQGRIALSWAKKELGVPYSWAGGDATGPTLGAVNEDGNDAGLHTVGFDCSGLTLFAWAHAGFSIDHYTGYQWVEGHHIDVGHMRPGDLVFFATDTSDPLTIHHVGIYVGGDQMIDAPHTGANVEYDKVFIPGFIGAVRP